MKLVIGDEIIEMSDKPIGIILSERDLNNIKNSEDITCYCQYPDGIPLEERQEHILKIKANSV